MFGIEIDTCARCGGTLRIIARIEQPEVIARILAHLERTAPPQPKPPEVPPGARAGFSGMEVAPLDTTDLVVCTDFDN